MENQSTFPDLYFPHLWFFQKTDKQVEKIQKEQDQEEDDDKGGKWILCKNCRKKITSVRNRIEVNGRHKHIFNNPEGIVFEIGCFSTAAGCLNHGFPTGEFTWFPGFNWSISICSNCHIHLGWFYHSGGKSSFFGLILNHLIEEDQ